MLILCEHLFILQYDNTEIIGFCQALSAIQKVVIIDDSPRIS